MTQIHTIADTLRDVEAARCILRESILRFEPLRCTCCGEAQGYCQNGNDPIGSSHERLPDAPFADLRGRAIPELPEAAARDYRSIERCVSHVFCGNDLEALLSVGLAEIAREDVFSSPQFTRAVQAVVRKVQVAEWQETKAEERPSVLVEAICPRCGSVNVTRSVRTEQKSTRMVVENETVENEEQKKIAEERCNDCGWLLRREK